MDACKPIIWDPRNKSRNNIGTLKEQLTQIKNLIIPNMNSSCFNTKGEFEK